MEPTLYTHNFAYYDMLYDFTTEELDEIIERAEQVINKKFESTVDNIISKMIDAKFAYNKDNQTLKNHLIFTIDSPNIFQPENIECIVFYKECENNIEVINISAYFG